MWPPMSLPLQMVASPLNAVDVLLCVSIHSGDKWENASKSA